MAVFFLNNKQLYNLNNLPVGVTLIKVGDPLCVEYKSINIVSSKFDRIGKSEIIIANNVKNVASKDRTVQSVTYYDEDARVIKKHIGSSKGVYKVTNFDASEYGYKTCAYFPGYQGTALSITTKMLEVDDYSSLSKVFKLLTLGVSSIGQLSGSPLIPLVNEAMLLCSTLITNLDAYTELCEEHTLALYTGAPVGLYVCIPELTDINLKKKLIQDYIVEDLGLYQVINGIYSEYNDSYFILEVSNQPRKDLCDFDFAASTADVISKITSKDVNVTDQIVTLSRQAYDMGLIQVVTGAYQTYLASGLDVDKQQLVALYRQLASGPMLSWFNGHFPGIAYALL